MLRFYNVVGTLVFVLVLHRRFGSIENFHFTKTNKSLYIIARRIRSGWILWSKVKIVKASTVMEEANSNSNQSMPSPPPPPQIITPPPQNAEKKPKLKILAFHGYRQNGTVFKGKIGSFRKAVSKYAQLYFLSAPHRVLSDDGAGEDDARSWWFNAEDNTFSGKCLGGPAIGFEDTLRLIESAVKEHGPFHGFMGFSQGACLVGLLAAMAQKGYLPYEFKFAIFSSGFKSGSLVHKGFYDEVISIPSLHVYGESDSIIPKEMSESLISLFSMPVVAEHSGGHYVACSGPTKDAYQDFLQDRYEDLLDVPEAKAETEATKEAWIDKNIPTY